MPDAEQAGRKPTVTVSGLVGSALKMTFSSFNLNLCYSSVCFEFNSNTM